jgi:hypothetical protein
MRYRIALPEICFVSIARVCLASSPEMINFSKNERNKERINWMGAIIQTIREMTVGGKLALTLACVWVFGLAACSGGGCIPGCGAKPPTPAPPQPQPRTHLVQVILQRDRIEMPLVLPPGLTLLQVTNRDNLSHYLEIERQGTEIMYGLDMMPGNTQLLKIILEPGRYRLWYPFQRSKAGKVQLVVTVTPVHDPA